MTVREAAREDAPAIAAVQVRSWEATYAGILPQEHIDRRTVELRTAQWTERLREGDDDILVACNPSGAIVGFTSGGRSGEPVEGYDAEIAARCIFFRKLDAGASESSCCAR